MMRATVFLVGAALGVAIVLSSRMPAGRAPVGVGLALSAQPSAKLGLTPAGMTFLRGHGLQPGASPARGTLQVSNYAASPVLATVRLVGSDRDLDRLVKTTVEADNKTVFRGKLGELRSWGAVRFPLAPKQRRGLTVRVWLPGSARHDFQGRSADLELEWRTEQAES
jgi:hypothetical protein